MYISCGAHFWYEKAKKSNHLDFNNTQKNLRLPKGLVDPIVQKDGWSILNNSAWNPIWKGAL